MAHGSRYSVDKNFVRHLLDFKNKSYDTAVNSNLLSWFCNFLVGYRGYNVFSYVYTQLVLQSLIKLMLSSIIINACKLSCFYDFLMLLSRNCGSFSRNEITVVVIEYFFVIIINEIFLFICI